MNVIVCTALVGYSVTEIFVGYFAIASVPSDKYFCWLLCDNINSQSHKFWLGTLCQANENFRWLLCDSITATLWKHQCPLKEISIGCFVKASVPTEGNFHWLLSESISAQCRKFLLAALWKHQCSLKEISVGCFVKASVPTDGNFRWLFCEASVPIERNFCWLLCESVSVHWRKFPLATLSQHQCPLKETSVGCCHSISAQWCKFATAWWKSLLAAFCYFWLGGLIYS